MSAKTKKELEQELEELRKLNKASQPTTIPDVILTLPLKQANDFVNLLNAVLVGDDRLIPIRHHFIELIKKYNEANTEQPR